MSLEAKLKPYEVYPVAIRAEMDAAGIYLGLHGRVKNEVLKQKLAINTPNLSTPGGDVGVGRGRGWGCTKQALEIFLQRRVPVRRGPLRLSPGISSEEDEGLTHPSALQCK